LQVTSFYSLIRCFDFEQELAADIQALSEATTRIGMSLEIQAPTTQTTAYVKVPIFLNAVGINYFYLGIVLDTSLVTIAFIIRDLGFSFFY
jgi:hypothetical protein